MAVAVGFSSCDAGIIGDDAFHQLPEALDLALCDRPP
jgi:hypothetical protein